MARRYPEKTYGAGRRPFYRALKRLQLFPLRSFQADFPSRHCRNATICGVKRLHGAEVSGKDLRGGAALLAAALAAGGGRIVDIGVLLQQTFRAVLAKQYQVISGGKANHFAELRCGKAVRSLAADVSHRKKRRKQHACAEHNKQSPRTLAEGTCMISETVFEARFSHGAELCRMGAAALCITVAPSARAASRRMFSVAPTLGKSK